MFLWTHLLFTLQNTARSTTRAIWRVLLSRPLPLPRLPLAPWEWVQDRLGLTVIIGNTNTASTAALNFNVLVLFNQVLIARAVLHQADAQDGIMNKKFSSLLVDVLLFNLIPNVLSAMSIANHRNRAWQVCVRSRRANAKCLEHRLPRQLPATTYLDLQGTTLLSNVTQ